MTKLLCSRELNEFRESLRQKDDPTKICVRICMTGCRAYGAEEVREAFKSEIQRRGLEDRVEIRDTGARVSVHGHLSLPLTHRAFFISSFFRTTSQRSSRRHS